MQIKSLQDLSVDHISQTGKMVHQPSLPKSGTPKPERNKVVNRPTRTPINKQSALMISPIRNWIYQPLPPEKLPNPFQKDLDEARAFLKIERNEHAVTRDQLGAERQVNKRLRKAIETVSEQRDQWRKKCEEQAETIRQLEDLKL